MNTCPCKASVIEPFASDLGVSCLLSALVKLTQANLSACKKSEPSEPPQFFMLRLGLDGQKRVETGSKGDLEVSELGDEAEDGGDVN